jgi:hypothetical protein
MDGQPAWRFCGKCNGMFFNGDPDRKGNCPGGGTHQAQGFVFYLLHDVPNPSTVGQPGWSFCDKCFGMFFVGNPGEPPLTTSHCQAGGQHRAQGFHFVLQHDVPSTVGQPGWSFCDKCNGMFFVGNPGEPPLTTSHCPAGGQHRAQGFHFVLPHREFPNPKIRIVVPPDRRSFAVEGRGFELGQPVKITHHRKSGSTLSEGIDQISSDSAGRFLFQVDFGGSIIDSGSALAFDFGSGETAKDSFG